MQIPVEFKCCVSRQMCAWFAAGSQLNAARFACQCRNLHWSPIVRTSNCWPIWQVLTLFDQVHITCARPVPSRGLLKTASSSTCSSKFGHQCPTAEAQFAANSWAKTLMTPLLRNWLSRPCNAAAVANSVGWSKTWSVQKVRISIPSEPISFPCWSSMGLISWRMRLRHISIYVWYHGPFACCNPLRCIQHAWLGMLCMGNYWTPWRTYINLPQGESSNWPGHSKIVRRLVDIYNS